MAEANSAENHAIVTTALENANTDGEEDKAIEKISNQVVTDEERSNKIQKDVTEL